MIRDIDPAKAKRIFERKLLDAEKQGARCNLKGIADGGCTHGSHLSCWADLFGLLFKAMNYGRRRGVIDVINPWNDRAWMQAARPPLKRKAK